LFFLYLKKILNFNCFFKKKKKKQKKKKKKKKKKNIVYSHN
jgi:hypothetical protein